MKILGIFRGFPGLGRVVAGVSLLETIKMNYNCEIKIISYLQGNKYLEKKGYSELQEATPLDYCSIGLLPTNKMGKYIHNVIRQFCPDMVLLDGEPLLLQSLRISYPSMKLAVLLKKLSDGSINPKKKSSLSWDLISVIIKIFLIKKKI